MFHNLLGCLFDSLFSQYAFSSSSRHYSELLSHCKPRPPMATRRLVNASGGAVELDPSSNATSRNSINMFPRAASIVSSHQSHVCSTEPSSSASDEPALVSLVFDTNLNDRLGTVKDVDDAHYWIDFSTIWKNSSMPAETPKDSLVVFWYPKHVKFLLPANVEVSRQADELCLQLTMEKARMHLASVVVEKGEAFQESNKRACKEALQFVSDYEETMQNLSAKQNSVFPPNFSDDECKSILAKLSEKTGVAQVNIRVQPFSALFSSDGKCAKCCEFNLMTAFHDFLMTQAGGSCIFCPTSDFTVQKAKKPNVHGCDLELRYSKSYCNHNEKETQWQMVEELSARFGRPLLGTGGGTSSKDCKVRLA